jgi:SAM-dependent methyltransferase
MTLTPAEWDHRFQQQTAWTQAVRSYVYQRVQLSAAAKILEIGCGTGAVLRSLPSVFTGKAVGLDIQRIFLQFAQQAGSSRLVCGDAIHLPFGSAQFDFVFCHFTLLWLANPPPALAELRRVTRPGGWVAALAEPDYGGRIDHPAPLAELGRMQGAALKAQGADPWMGRKLNGLFHQAGLDEVETGLLGGQWNSSPDEAAWESEWSMLAADLAGTISVERLHELRSLDASAWQHGERILFVPTFYAFGKVPT